MTVDRVARLLVGEVLHGLKCRRTCGRMKATFALTAHIQITKPEEKDRLHYTTVMAMTCDP